MVLVPSAIKNQKIYSVKPTDGSGDLTFSRASNATRVNSSGLVEKVRENLLLQSNQFDTTWTQNGTTVTGGQSDKDGGTDAWLLEAIAGSGSQRQSISASGVVSYSVYAKAGNVDWVRLRIDASTDTNAWFDLGTGSVGTNEGIYATITSVGGGWYRIILVVNNASINTVRIYPTNADAIGGSIGDNIYIQNAQLEYGDIATDYIPTTTAAVSVGPVSGLPRLDYSGGCPSLLLEPQTTALNQYSEQYDNAYWTKQRTTITANAEISPDGYQNADILTANTTTGEHNVYTPGISTTSAAATFSCFVKPLTGRYFSLSMYQAAGGFGPYATFDLLNGTAVETGAPYGTYIANSIEQYGNGWFRVSVTGSGITSNLLGLNAQDADHLTPGDSWTGANESYAIWGTNLTQTSYIQSYVPTLGSSVTRLADAAYKTGISSLIGQTEGTFFVEIQGYTDALSGNTFFGITESTANNRLLIGQSSTANQFRFYVDVDAYGGGFNYSVTDITEPQKLAIVYSNSGNDIALYLNGAQKTSFSTSNTFSASLTDLVSNNGAGTQNAEFNVKQIIVFPTALTDAQAIELTTL